MRFSAAEPLHGWREPKLLKYGRKFRSASFKEAWIAIVCLNIKQNNRRERARVTDLAARPTTRLPPVAG
jgi:hypothetical protein